MNKEATKPFHCFTFLLLNAKSTTLHDIFFVPFPWEAIIFNVAY